MKRLFALLVLIVAFPVSAETWWNKEWKVRKEISIDTKAAEVSGDSSSVPVLIRLSTGNFDFLSAKPDGTDLRFLAQDDVTVLKFHIERFSSNDEIGFAWVQVPKIAGSTSGQHIWLYSGNEKAPVLADSKSTYDPSQLFVLHFSETQGLPQDATANGSHVTQGNVAYSSAGLIGGGGKLTGDGGLTVSNPSLQGAKEFTFSSWVKPERSDGELLTFGDLKLRLEGGVPAISINGVETRGSTPLLANSWHHIAVAVGRGLTLYVDGKPVANTQGQLVPGSSLRIGGGLLGEIDEVQVSLIERPAAWLLAQVESQSQSGKLLKYGEDKTTESGEESSYFVTTMKNVTVDGWVVVIICALMFVIAIWVMVVKSLFLGRMQKANESFSEAFGKMTRGLSELDESAVAHASKMDHLGKKADEFKHSSLYRIYHVGITELKRRFPSGDDAHTLPNISARSMNAVRASLDAQLTREGQGMNKAMVLLTIAISGGPFLGLLGTVVGVMITFAAIAAAGDVNVNAIAPGIAAALVATVAGLGVAIPALFGYNYLMTKIKSMSADMHVFVDEFVTKMAENYGS